MEPPFFRFRSRRLQTTEFAFDALVYQNYEGETKLKSSPLDCVLAQLEVVSNNWDSLLDASSQFLSSFVRLFIVDRHQLFETDTSFQRVEVLEERLETDRSQYHSKSSDGGSALGKIPQSPADSSESP